MFDVNVFGVSTHGPGGCPVHAPPESREDCQYQLNCRQDGYSGKRYLFVRSKFAIEALSDASAIGVGTFQYSGYPE